MFENLLSASFYEQITNKIIEWGVENLPSLLLTVVIFFVAVRLVKVSLRKFQKRMVAKISEEEETHEKEKRVNTLIEIIRGVLVVTLWVIFLMIILQKLGVEIAPLLAGAGIAGLAIGFGAQELVRDAITGFFLLLENRIRAGDVCIINGQGGLVENINLRTVTLRDLSGVVHTFQNGKIDTMANMTKDWSARVFDIGVAYKEDVNQVIGIIKEVGKELKNDPAYSALINEDIEIFGLDNFGDSAVVIKARLKTKPGEQWVVGREFNRRLKYAFDNQGIEIPFPHQTIYWGDEINPLKIEQK